MRPAAARSFAALRMTNGRVKTFFYSKNEGRRYSAAFGYFFLRIFRLAIIRHAQPKRAMTQLRPQIIGDEITAMV